MTTMKIENAKAAEKVAFFENLKETHDGKIFTDDVLEAWNLATCTLGKLKKNNTKTINAGYTVLENSVGDWVSVLNDRFEVNLATGQTFNIWTDSDVIRNAANYAWDEVEENIFHAKNADEKTFWLNVCKAKFVNSLITLGVKDLVAAEIIREEEIIGCIDDYFVNSDDAAEVEFENKIENEIRAHDYIAIKPKVLTVTESEIKAAVSEYDSVSIPFDDFIIDVAVDEGLPNWEREQAKLERKQAKLERRHYVAECKAKAKIISDFFKKIGIPKKALKISIDDDVVVREGGFKSIDVIYFEPKTEKINEKQLEKIATYFEDDYTHLC